MRLDSLDILAVWDTLGGGELRGKRGRAFWRDGDGYSISLHREKAAWYDFRDGRGGGILDLVTTARHCDRKEALNWLETHCGLDPLRTLTGDERRRRTLAQSEASELIQWRNRMLDALRGERDRSFRLYHAGARWILENGLNSELASAVADSTERIEQRALEAQRGVQLLAEMRFSDLLPIFREKRGRTVAA